MTNKIKTPKSQADRRNAATARLSRLAASIETPDPALPIVMHGLARYAQGITPESDVDRAIAQAFAGKKLFTRANVAELVASWAAVPAASKARAVPATLRNLSTSVPFRETMVGLGDVLPQITDVKSSAGLTPGADGVARVKPGAPFTIVAKRIPADPSKIQVKFAQAKHVIAVVAPSKALAHGDEVLLTVTAPKAFGVLSAQLLLDSGFASNRVSVSSPAPHLKFAPQIQKVSPPAVYPGQSVTLTGFFLVETLHVLLQDIDFAGRDFSLQAPADNDATRTTFVVPQTIPPGRYKIGLANSSGHVVGNLADLTIRAPKYRVIYDTLHCVDESDTEGESDDIVTGSVIKSDPNFQWIWKTKEYGNMGDGMTRPYKPNDALIFPKTGNGGWLEVNDFLAIMTILWEWDTTDHKHAIEVLSEIGDAASGIAAMFGPWGVLVSGITKILNEALSSILSILGNAPDYLGEQSIAKTATELQVFTSDAQGHARPQSKGTLSFMNNDDTGSYRIAYTIFRDQPA